MTADTIDRPTRVLLVEDDRAIASMMEMYLVLEGFEVTHVADGVSAQYTVHAVLPDVVLLDLMLPEKSGLDVARWIRQESSHRDVAIVMLTSLAHQDQVWEGLLAGANSYVRKPVELPLVVNEIRRILRDRTSEVPRTAN